MIMQSSSVNYHYNDHYPISSTNYEYITAIQYLISSMIKVTHLALALSLTTFRTPLKQIQSKNSLSNPTIFAPEDWFITP